MGKELLPSKNNFGWKSNFFKKVLDNYTVSYTHLRAHDAGDGGGGFYYGEFEPSGEGAGGYGGFFAGAVYGVSGEGCADWDFVFGEQE